MRALLCHKMRIEIEPNVSDSQLFSSISCRLSVAFISSEFWLVLWIVTVLCDWPGGITLDLVLWHSAENRFTLLINVYLVWFRLIWVECGRSLEWQPKATCRACLYPVTGWITALMDTHGAHTRTEETAAVRYDKIKLRSHYVWRNLETEVSLWKRIKCFPFTLLWGNLNTQQSLDLCLRKTWSRKSSFMCSVHTRTKTQSLSVDARNKAAFSYFFCAMRRLTNAGWICQGHNLQGLGKVDREF